MPRTQESAPRKSAKLPKWVVCSPLFQRAWQAAKSYEVLGLVSTAFAPGFDVMDCQRYVVTKTAGRNGILPLDLLALQVHRVVKDPRNLKMGVGSEAVDQKMTRSSNSLHGRTHPFLAQRKVIRSDLKPHFRPRPTTWCLRIIAQVRNCLDNQELVALTSQLAEAFITPKKNILDVLPCRIGNCDFQG